MKTICICALALAAFTPARPANAGLRLGTTWSVSDEPTIHNRVLSPVATPSLDLHGEGGEMRFHVLDLLAGLTTWNEGYSALGVDFIANGKEIPVRDHVAVVLRPSLDTEISLEAANAMGVLRCTGKIEAPRGAGLSVAMAPGAGLVLWDGDLLAQFSVRFELSAWMPFGPSTRDSSEREP